MSATPDTYTAFAAWVTSTKPWWVTDLSRYEGERYRHEETWKAFEAFAAGRGSVVAAEAAKGNAVAMAAMPGQLVQIGEVGAEDLAVLEGKPAIGLKTSDGRHLLLIGLTRDECTACAGAFNADVTIAVFGGVRAAQPAPAGVVEALRGLLQLEDARLSTGAFTPNAEGRRRIDGARAALAAADAAQAAPVQAVPLTDEQIVMDAIMMMPTSVANDCTKACEYGIRYAERHHGITGDKHG